MDQRRPAQQPPPPHGDGAGGGGGGGMCYSALFNLEPLLNFRVPIPEDLDQSGNSSQDGSVSSQGQGALPEQYNGSHEMRKKRKRRMDGASDDEDDDSCGNQITEEHYRSMLSEHVQKYKNLKPKESAFSPDSARMAMPKNKNKNGMKRKRKEFREVDASPEYNGREREADYGGSDRVVSSLDSSYLDIGDGITYQIPPGYEKLALSLKLPSLSDIKVEEQILKGMLDLRSLAAMIAPDRRAEVSNHRCLGEPQSQYESLQARLKVQKFSLQVTEDPFAIPEGTAGRIRRSIMSESGNMQLYYVKVLEKGDTYEIIERSLPKKQIVKKDPARVEKEEMDKIGKVWMNIVKRDLPRQHRVLTNFHKRQQADAKRFSEYCQREVRLKVNRSLKMMRLVGCSTKKLARDMVLFWKRVDREQAELKKKEEREAAEALKREEELREAKRQQQRLNFLLSQTELFTHFMQNKSGQSAQPEEKPCDEPGEEEDPEEAELRREALMAAQHAVSQQKKITDAFDTESSRLRQAADVGVLPSASAIAESSNMNLLNPSTMPEQSTVETPELFNGILKEYQLKGLQWLVNCYEQGLNGILADEMGLGKTIQAMAFLAYLAEEKNIWGPFLVVAPSSVLNNWAEEISRFCPDLKTLPYWGGLSERTILRKNINPKRLYRRDSPFHILITSYQLLVSDEKYLRRVKWQYMVLDEAQAIKSSNSIRWKTLLSFNCRNRLLLTGTPIQNNMAELWALLHFIMPTLFDSHEQFNEWFSKGIESHAEHGGTVNEHQLNRLHAVLKPFMLRRVKKDVISEISGKTEITVHCKLSSRQQAFYQAVKNKISLNELFDGRRGHLNDKKLVNLMNIVMQLRKVCNHPELFERNEGSSYFYFADIPNSLLSPPFGELEDVYYAGERNPIMYKVPKLVYREIISSTEMPSTVTAHCIQHGSLDICFNIFSPDNVYYSSLPQHMLPNKPSLTSGAFGFTRLMNLSPNEATFVANCALFEGLSFSIIQWNKQNVDEILDTFLDSEDDEFQFSHVDKGKFRAVARMLLLPTKSESRLFRTKLATGPGDSPYEALVTSHYDRLISNIRLLRATHAFIPLARAPLINVWCPDRNFSYKLVEELHHPWIKKLFLGFARTSQFNGPREPIDPHPLIQEMDTDLPISEPVLQLPYRIFGSSPPMSNFDPAKMLTDSGKLQTLDVLLRRLRAENHRVLLFAQMTKMLDILEDYMNFRKYKYLRLDGSSTIVDRRDMVRDFQSRNDVFVFLLSTRAGGLGINLTAADTVIFYEIDWNPTLDMQAMDRAHRLGQTKEVTVYRLICKDTVEDKILQRANQKNKVQQLVMTGQHVQDDLMGQEDVISLLLDDAQLEQKMKEISMQAKDRQQKKKRGKGVRVDAEGDVTLEDFDARNPEAAELENSNNRKKKSSSHKRPSKLKDTENIDNEVDDLDIGNEEEYVPQQRPKRSKRLIKSISEDIEPISGSGTDELAANMADNKPPSDYKTEDQREALPENIPTGHTDQLDTAKRR